MGGGSSKVMDGIYQGGSDVLKDENFWTSRAITHVISVGEQRPSAPLTLRLNLNVLHIPKGDLPRVSLREDLERTAVMIHKARLGDGVVYVHCMAGISRSSTIVLAYLMAWLGLDFQTALDFLTERRECACPNPGFRAQLQEFAREGAAAKLGAKLLEMGGRKMLEDDRKFVDETMKIDSKQEQPKRIAVKETPSIQQLLTEAGIASLQDREKD
eukprot:1014756_1